MIVAVGGSAVIALVVAAAVILFVSVAVAFSRSW